MSLKGRAAIYAADPHAFKGKESLLAEAFQTPADAFVTNADLSFSTREAARQLPERIEEKARVDQAAGVLSAVLGWSPDDARRRLRDAAGRAGTPVAKVADVLITMAASG